MFENVPTVSSLERQQVLQALERLQLKLVQREEWTHSERLGALRDALQSPLLGHILTLQHSVKQLRDQLNRMPPDTSSEFSFSRKGQLIFSASCPPSNGSSIRSNGTSLSSMASMYSANQLQKWIQTAAKGRKIEHVSLPKPLSGGLGFSVVGLRPEGVGSHGVFIRHIQPGSIADRSHRLQENDQILAINGMPLEESVTQQQALSLLQQQREHVDLIVARDKVSAVGSINTEQWGHVEEIELVNDGSGLGFGIVGGKATGVVVRTLVPNSVAHKDGRLHTGDHILRIGDTSTQGLASDQVVRVLQECGSRVRMLVARDPLRPPCQAPALPPAPVTAPAAVLPPPAAVSPPPAAALPPPVPLRRTSRASRTPNLEGYEIHEVSLKKKEGQSLGISIIGHNSLSSEDAVGVYVKNVVPGSAADQTGNIYVHDRIIALDGVNLQGFTNQEVLEVMKQTGQMVALTVVRRIAPAKHGHEKSLDKVHREFSRVSLKRSSEVKIRSDIPKAAIMELLDTTNTASEPFRTADPSGLVEHELREKWEQALGPHYDVLILQMDPLIEDDSELQKYSKLHPIHTMRLGVELDSFDGHHYISSINPDGPVAKHGLLRPEDELLEVNGVQLYGKSRREAVAFLREVPPPFTLVCCRLLSEEPEMQDWRTDSPVSREPEQEQAGTSVSTVDSECTAPGPADRNVEDDDGVARDEEDDDEDGELALWASEVQVVELEKAEQGLGFSILDYQDPLDATRSVIVIRSLVSGGVAEQNGGLLPGDQLVFVNDTYLDSCSLTQAVEVLKALPLGTVYLGIRKPLADESKTGYRDWQTGKDHNMEEPAVKYPLVDQNPPTHKDFEDASVTLGNEEDLESEPELILDSMPRYASPLIANDDRTPRYSPHLNVEDHQPYNCSLATAEDTPCLEREMAVDEEENEEENQQQETVEGGETTYHRQVSPTKDDQTVSDLMSFSPLPHELEEQKDEATENSMEVEEMARPTALPTESHPILPMSSVVEPGDIWADSDSQSDGGSGLNFTDNESLHTSTSEKKKRGQTATALSGGEQSYLPQREEGEGEETPAFSHWGPPHRVDVWQEPEEPLGISIVGGRTLIKRLRNGEELKGIFIKQVLPDSPAGRCGALKTGDKILQVGGVDLQNASHEEAVEAIKAASSPVVFIVQSLSTTPRPISVLAPSYSKHKAKKKASTPPLTMVGTAGLPPPMRLPPPYRPPSKLPEEPLDQHKELEQDREGIRQRYGELPGELLLLELEKDRQGLGLSLAGNRDRNQLSIFVVGITAGGPAYRDGRIQVGDELLEINNQVLYGRSHQSASAIIKSAPSKVKIVLIRNKDAVNQMAVSAIPTPPSLLPDEEPVSNTSAQEAVEKSLEMEESSNFAPLEEENKVPDEVQTKVFSKLTLKSLERDKELPDEVQTEILLNPADMVCNSPQTTSEPPVDSLDTSLMDTTAASPSTPSPDIDCCSKDLTTCPILPGQETVIEISKGRSGLGLSIVGGKDTKLV